MKLLTKEICPHCKKDFESEKDLEGPFENFEIKKHKGSIEKITTEKTQEPEVKEVIKEVTKTQTPPHIPSFKCKDGNCGLMHKNPNYTKQIKGKCTNCGQFTSNTDSECPFCNKKEYDEIDEDELKELGIPEPLGKDIHDHTE